MSEGELAKSFLFTPQALCTLMEMELHCGRFLGCVGMLIVSVALDK